MAVNMKKDEPKVDKVEGPVAPPTRTIKLALYKRFVLMGVLFEAEKLYTLDDATARSLLSKRDDYYRPLFIEHFPEEDRRAKEREQERAEIERVVDLSGKVFTPQETRPVQETLNVLDISDNDPEITARLAAVDQPLPPNAIPV